MSATALALWACMLNLLFIAALPRVFFRRGHLNAQWWLTAAPFAAAGLALLLQLPHAVAAHTLAASAEATVAAGLLPAVLPMAAVALACASIALIAFTVGTHREPVSLWHQQDDAPHRIVRHGAYARVRHPFYAAFLLALAGTTLAAPGPLTATAFGAAALLLHKTARREEARLLASGFGTEYAAYMAHTGRFVPRRTRRLALHAGASRQGPGPAPDHASSRPPARM